MIIYTIHALERIRKRGINREAVELCLNKPDNINKLNDIYRAVKKLNKHILIVAYRFEEKNILVITVFKSSKIRKYL